MINDNYSRTIPRVIPRDNFQVQRRCRRKINQVIIGAPNRAVTAFKRNFGKFLPLKIAKLVTE